MNVVKIMLTNFKRYRVSRDFVSPPGKQNQWGAFFNIINKNEWN